MPEGVVRIERQDLQAGEMPRRIRLARIRSNNNHIYDTNNNINVGIIWFEDIISNSFSVGYNDDNHHHNNNNISFHFSFNFRDNLCSNVA